jgi:predicted alpha/beta hydrolase family esterase
VGHLMASEGYGPWPAGEELLAGLLDGSSDRRLETG